MNYGSEMVPTVVIEPDSEISPEITEVIVQSAVYQIILDFHALN